VLVPWRSGVHCLHFFIHGPGAQYFEGQAAESRPAIPSEDVDLEAIKKELDQAMQQAEEEARRQITEPEEAREPNPRLRRVGRVAHPAAFDGDKLRELVSPVDDEEPELQVLRKAFDWLIQDAPYHSYRSLSSVGIYDFNILCPIPAYIESLGLILLNKARNCIIVRG
jgi:hypothetical protein